MSTVVKRGVGTPTVLCGGFFSGLLEALLGKPGTLHSPGQIFTSALGVPPDLRGAPVLGRSLGVRGRVEGVGCILADPVGRVCLCYQAGTFPPAQVRWGSSSNSFTPRPSAYYFCVPCAAKLVLSHRRVVVKGREPADSVGVALHPTVSHCVDWSTLPPPCAQ